MLGANYENGANGNAREDERQRISIYPPLAQVEEVRVEVGESVDGPDSVGIQDAADLVAVGGSGHSVQDSFDPDDAA